MSKAAIIILAILMTFGLCSCAVFHSSEPAPGDSGSAERETESDEMYNTETTINNLNVYIQNALLQQERIQEIKEINTTPTGKGFKSSIHCLLVNGTDETLEIDLTEDIDNG